MSGTEQSLLDAMDGIAMILDRDLCILRLGEPNWQQFLDENPPSERDAHIHAKQDVHERPVTQFFAGNAVRATFAALFHSVMNGDRPVVQFSYRCDAPTLRRSMRLSVRPIMSGKDVRHLLYQSIVLSSEPRPALALFGAPVATRDADDILTLCAICARVAWPVGAPTGEREWIEPTEYYHRGGGEVVLISHGFCEACFAHLQDED